MVVLNILANTSKIRYKGCVKGTDLKGLLPYPDSSVSLKAKVSMPCPELHSGAAMRFCTLPHRERQVNQTPRPVRSPEKEAQKARSDGGKTHFWTPRKPGHTITT